MEKESGSSFLKPFFTGVVGGGATVALCVHLATGDPFYFNGQPVGFLNKVKELEADNAGKASEIEDLKRGLGSARLELSKLQTENEKFQEEKKAAERSALDIWYPLDAVQFYYREGDDFNANKYSGKGKWVSPDRELSFRLISLDDEEAVFETSFPEPYNQMRFVKNANFTSSGYTWSGEKWKYSFAARFTYPSTSVVLKIDRQRKPSPT